MVRAWWLPALVFLAVVGGGGTAQYAVSRALVDHKDAAPTALEVVPGKRFVRFTAFGFDKVMADVYWIRAIQYFNNETLKPRDPTRLKGPLLGPLAEAITTLDPHFHGAYYYASLFLRILRRYEEALALLEKGEAANPNIFMYPSEQGNVCYFDLRDRPVVDPALDAKGIATYRDLAIRHYKRAAGKKGVTPFFERFLQSLLTGRGEFRMALELWIQSHAAARNQATREYYEDRIRDTFALEFSRSANLAVREAAERTGSPPPPPTLPALPGLTELRLRPMGEVEGYFAFATPPVGAGPVTGFRDILLYDLGRGNVRSLFRARRMDEELREGITQGVEGFRREKGRLPAEGLEGMRELLEWGFRFRTRGHPLGGHYLLDESGKVITDRGWNEKLEALEARLGD
jgi:tetratricopeptide (TPR) repeat protein